MSRFQREFKEWLAKNGAIVLAETNSYEVARFVAHGATHVIYEGKRGISANGFAEKCYHAFIAGKPMGMGFTNKQDTQTKRFRQALVNRDGSDCFYCLNPLGEDITIEHLISKQNGGPNHIDNMVLAHKVCNQGVGKLPLIEKINLRCKQMKR